MSFAFISTHHGGQASASSLSAAAPPADASLTSRSAHAEQPTSFGFVTPAATAVAAAFLALSARAGRRHRRTAAAARRTSGVYATPSFRALGPIARALKATRGLLSRRRAAAVEELKQDDAQAQEYEEQYSYALRMVKIFLAVTFVPFLFCAKNFFFDPRNSDFNLEYGPHLAAGTLRATSLIQAIMIACAIFWRERNKDSKMDRLFAWLFVPEGIMHIALHYLNHVDNWFGNFAFGYAFSAGIALPGFLSLMAYCPKNKVFPWLYMALYVVTQIPICAGLTDMVGPAKMRLNFANLNTATITGPFFYGILKRWNDIPKVPVFLACATITYQVTMGIIGPIQDPTGALKLYDPSVVMQHAIVDVGFGISYTASIYYGLFRKGKEWNR